MEQSVKVEMWNWVSNQVSPELGDPVPASWTSQDPGMLQENDASLRGCPHASSPWPWGLQKYWGDDSFECIENGVSPHRSKLF